MNKIKRLIFPFICATLVINIAFSQNKVDRQLYRISAGDTLSITVWNDKELSGSMIVALDGTLTFPPPIGRIIASGLTIGEFETEVKKKLAQIYREPQVTVSVVAFGGFFVHIVGGGIAIPNTYNIVEGTTLQEVVTSAGGFTDFADQRSVTITRSDQKIIVDFSQFLTENRLSANPVLRANDQIFVPTLSLADRRKQFVTIFGSANKTGSYPIGTDSRLFDLIGLAGGTSAEANLNRIQLIDINSDPPKFDTIDFELFLSRGDLAGNPKISSGTVIYVPRLETTDLSFAFNIGGQVVRSGNYNAIEGVRLLDGIFLAGGPTEDARIDQIQILRLITENEKEPSIRRLSYDLNAFLETGDLTANPLLQNSDTIFVPISPRSKSVPILQTAFVENILVQVIGEVKSSSIHQVPINSTVLDLIILSEGFTSEADLEKITVIRDQGDQPKWIEFDLTEVQAEGRFDLLPKLIDGDTIFIPQRREETSFWRSVISFARDLSAIVALFMLLRRG